MGQARKVKKEETQAKKVGRPKEDVADKVDLVEVEKLASLGLTDVEIGGWFSLSERTINNYKKDRAFLSALKKGKMVADANVVRALYNNAVTGNNVVAQLFWLKNRMPDRWRDRLYQEHSFEKESRSAIQDMMQSIREDQ